MKNIKITIGKSLIKEAPMPEEFIIPLPEGILFDGLKGDADYAQHDFTYMSDGVKKYGCLAVFSNRNETINPNVDFESFWSQASAAGIDGYTVNLLNYFQKLLKTTDKGGLWEDGREATQSRINSFLSTEQKTLDYRLIQVLNDSEEMGLIKSVWQNTVLASAPDFMKGVQLNYYRQSDTDSYNAEIATCSEGNRVYNPYPSTNQTVFWDYKFITGESSEVGVDAIISNWLEKQREDQCEGYKNRIGYSIDDAETCLGNLKQEVSDCKDELKSKSDQLEDFEQSLAEDESTAEDLRNEILTEETNLAKAQEELEACILDPNCTEKEQADLEAAIVAIQETIDAAQKALDELELKIAKLKNEISTLNQQVAVLTAQCAAIDLAASQQLTALNALYCCDPVFRFDKICNLKGCASAPQSLYFKTNPLSSGNEIARIEGQENEGDEPFDCCYQFIDIQYDCSNSPSELFEISVQNQYPANASPCDPATGISDCQGEAEA